MTPEAISSTAPAIPGQDRRGSDAPLMLPTTLITCSPGGRFNGAYNETVVLSGLPGPGLRFAGVSPLEGRDVELCHTHHRLHHPGRLRLVGAGDHVEEDGRDDLPAQAVLVRQPPADALPAAAVDEAAPVVVDLGLIRARDHDRDRLVELELRAAVQGRELLPVELEVHEHDRARGARARLVIAVDAAYRRVFEDAGVK